MTRTTTHALVLAMGLLSSSDIIRGDPSPASTPQATPQTPRFRVGVDAVRIDAVVTDRDGRTVPDLTADDFEVRQDGKPQKVTFADSEGGKKMASADVLGMVFDQEGTEVAHLSTGFSVALTNEAAEEALRDGLAYTLRIPIPRAGAYQVRFAVRDQHSGALGAAGEFLDVADMAGGAFALSGIVLRSDDGTVSQVSGDADPSALTPAQALRVYRPGTRLAYAYEVYNATTPVQATTSLWRGAEQVFAAAADTLIPPPGGDRRFAAAGGVKLGEGLPPGSYVLQVSATTADPKRQGKSRIAEQRIGFDVR